jgi:hypothetical protein
VDLPKKIDISARSNPSSFHFNAASGDGLDGLLLAQGCLNESMSTPLAAQTHKVGRGLRTTPPKFLSADYADWRGFKPAQRARIGS